MTEADFSPEAFAADEHHFPEAYPLSFKEIAFKQAKDKEVQEFLEKQPDKYKKVEFKHSDDTYELVTRDGKIYLPKKFQKKATEWYHIYLCHQGELVPSSPLLNTTVR
jgi:hypothetical protein